MSIQEQISKRVREFRIKRDLTQEQLADLAGISPNFLNRIENCKEQPSFETIESIAKSLRVSMSVLMAWVKDATINDNDIAKVAIAYHKLSPKQKKVALPLVINLLKTLKET